MTPNEIATDISGLKSIEGGNITTSTNFTFCYNGMDDSNTWD